MHIYFSGIGGVGLGPLAEIARQAGHNISGSDLHNSPTFSALKQEGFNISLDQSGKHLAKVDTRNAVDWFVHTAALPSDHPELSYARSHKMKVTKRDELLKNILKQTNQKLIAVAGTHGKTTTTAMIVWLFKQLKLPISYLIGAPMSWAPSGRFDKASKYFVYECDEFDRNFLQFHPYISAITSISYDHADTYPTQASYNDAFDQFKAQSEQVVSWDNVESQPLHLAGIHNRSNGAVAIKVVSQVMSRPSDQLVPLLDNFPGTSRRFEKLADNLYSNYAHHPDEIAATLQHASELSEHIVAVYQPHQNIRQHHIDYTGSFDKAEKVYWLPTYLSREDPNLPILTPQQLTQKLDQNKIIFADLNNQLADSIRKEQAAGKLVLIMGAGSIDAWARENLL